MKLVIYKALGTIYVTTEENYNARIQNARKIHKLDAFDSVEEVIEYYCKHYFCKVEDFIIIEEEF